MVLLNSAPAKLPACTGSDLSRPMAGAKALFGVTGQMFPELTLATLAGTMGCNSSCFGTTASLGARQLGCESYHVYSYFHAK